MNLAAILILFVISIIASIRMFGSRIVRTYDLDE